MPSATSGQTELVAVIGAGAAGLTAAYHLGQAGKRVVVLEARGRAGGRVFTRRHDAAGAVELGAEFVHGEPAATLDLMRAGGIGVLPLDSAHWRLERGRFAPMDGEMGDTDELMAMARKEKTDRSVAAFLADVEHDPKLTESARWMRNLLQGFDAADPERASLQSIVREWSGPSLIAGQARPAGGYGKLVDFMVQRLDQLLVELRLGVPVRRVAWSPGRVELTVGDDQERIVASAVVIAVPLSLLQAGASSSSAIQFSPPLASKAAALAGLAMGPVHRVMLRYATPPWEALLEKPTRAATFLHGPGQPFRTFWTGDEGSPWLTAWCGGPPAAQLGALPDAGIVEQAVASARAMFSEVSGSVPDPVEVQFHNWQRDPWSQGAYSYVAVGGTGAHAALAVPVGGVLYFAGEATDATGEAGTVAGAIMSGERAAKEVLAGPQ